jgi:hypothetical protein
MMDEFVKNIHYFKKKGPTNTQKALEVALEGCKEYAVNTIVVASSTGDTALRLQEMVDSSIDIIAVTYSAGIKYTDKVETFNRRVDTLLGKGIRIVRGIHAFSGVERGLENKYKSGLTPLNIIADTLRMFGQGMKVCVEISTMAAEHGFILPDNRVVAVAGSGSGADTVVLIKPAFAARIFETRIEATLCIPV